MPHATIECYQNALQHLRRSDVPYLLGGAFAYAYYTGVFRNTKDLDVFIRPADRDRALEVLSDHGFHTFVRFPYWLAKAIRSDNTIDFIYRSPDGRDEVSDTWFARSVEALVLDVPVRLVAPEEILFSKAYILNNDRNDLADVMHLLRNCADRLNWDYLLARFAGHWRVLLAHCVLYGFVFPAERDRVPARVIEKLTQQLLEETHTPPPATAVCNGTLFSHSQYTVDLKAEGYEDGRLQPHGHMTPQELIDATISLDDPLRKAPK